MAKRKTKFQVRAKRQNARGNSKPIKPDDPDTSFLDVSLSTKMGILFLRQQVKGVEDSYDILTYTKKEAIQLRDILDTFLQDKDWKDEYV